MFPRLPKKFKLLASAAILALLLIGILRNLGQLSHADLKTSYLPTQFYKPKSGTDQHFDLSDLFELKFRMQGHHYDSRGVHKELEHQLTSSVIHSFSPYVENRFKEIILDPREEQRVYANSPAIMWYKGELLAVLRIWLEKEKYSDGIKAPANDFNDNFLYIQKFNRQMKPITPGGILGLPTPRQWTVGDGPIEPRLFRIGNDVFVSYNTGVYLKNRTPIDSTFIWDYNRHKTILPSIKEGSPVLKNYQKNRMPRDKHWTPYNNQGSLHMVYNLDPLRVLQCTSNFSCHFVHFEGPDNYQFHQYKDAQRGGTPWIEYQYPYYLGIGHTTLFKNPQNDRVYTMNILLLKATPKPRIVYTSGPIQLHKKPLSDVPIVRFLYIQDPFFFPVSLILEDTDSIVIGGHINDYSSALVRVRGIRSLVNDVILSDKTLPEDEDGPPIGTLHNSSRYFVSEVTKYKFYAR